MGLLRPSSLGVPPGPELGQGFISCVVKAVLGNPEAQNIKPPIPWTCSQTLTSRWPSLASVPWVGSCLRPHRNAGFAGPGPASQSGVGLLEGLVAVVATMSGFRSPDSKSTEPRKPSTSKNLWALGNCWRPCSDFLLGWEKLRGVFWACSRR